MDRPSSEFDPWHWHLADSVGQQLLDRFRVVRPIGEGATSQVFEVIDRAHGGHFALKRLRLERLSPERVARFKDEFRALERTSHPNLAKVYELIVDERGLSLLMELVEGVDFLRYVRPGAEPPPAEMQTTGPSTERCVAVRGRKNVGGTLSIARLRDGLAQLVHGLRALHALGKIHSDVKPENVLVTSQGRLVVVDFGLVTDIAFDDHWRGTPAFMAPEQFDGVFTEAVDWYAVGMLLHCALSDRLVTTGSPTALSLSRRVTLPVDPRIHASGLPEDLVDLTLRMLDPRPERRPSGEQIERSLGIVREAGHAPLRRALFVGRAVELERLAEDLAAARAGGTRVVHVHGEPGIGKTTLIHRFAREVRERGALVFRGACYQDVSVPYKGLDNIMDRIAATLVRFELELDESDRRVLATMFPVFRGAHEHAFEPASALEPAQVRARAVAALRALFEQLAGERGLLLCIDDVQWSDSESLELLAALLEQPPPRGLLLVLGYRSYGDGMGERVQEARQILPCHADLALGPLDREALRALVVADAAEVAPADLEALIAESGGNPFFAGELLRVRASGFPCGAPSLEAAISRRMDSLDASRRAYLELVAIAGRPIDERVLRSALGTSQDEALEARRVLIAASFLCSADDRMHALEPYHDRIREQLLRELPEERAGMLHAALALAYEHEQTTDPEILAVHYRAAGNRPKAILYTELAGDAATLALAFDHAAELYQAALALAEGERRELLRRKLAQALSSAGRPAEAAQVFTAALAQRPQDLDLSVCAGDELLKAGEIERGLELLRTVAADLGEPFPRSRFMATIRLVWSLLRSNLLPLRIVADCEVSEQERKLFTFCQTVTTQLVWIDYRAAALFCLRQLVLALEAGSRLDIIRGLTHKASFVCSRPGGLAGAERLLAQADALTQASDPALVRGGSRFARAVLDFSNGHWRSASLAFDETLDILRDNRTVRRHWSIAFCQCGIIENLRMAGDVAQLRERLAAFRGEARGHRTLEAFLALRGGTLLALCDDAPERALAIVAENMASWPSAPARLPRYFGTIAEVEIDLYRGAIAAAGQAVRRSRRIMGATGLHNNAYYLVQQLAIEARALLAQGALRSARRRIRKLRRRPEAWARAFGTALLGCLLAHRGERSAAQRALREAVAGIDECGLGFYSAAARYRLATLTGDSPARQAALEDLGTFEVAAPERLVSSLFPVPA